MGGFLTDKSEKMGQLILKNIEKKILDSHLDKDVRQVSREKFIGLLGPVVTWVCDIQTLVDKSENAQERKIKFYKDSKSILKKVQRVCTGYSDIPEVDELNVFLKKISKKPASLRPKRQKKGRPLSDDFEAVLVGSISLCLENCLPGLRVKLHQDIVGKIISQFSSCDVVAVGIKETTIKNRLKEFQSLVFPDLYKYNLGNKVDLCTVTRADQSTKRGEIVSRYPISSDLASHLIELSKYSSKKEKMWNGVGDTNIYEFKAIKVSHYDSYKQLSDWVCEFFKAKE